MRFHPLIADADQALAYVNKQLMSSRLSRLSEG